MKKKSVLALLILLILCTISGCGGEDTSSEMDVLVEDLLKTAEETQPPQSIEEPPQQSAESTDTNIFIEAVVTSITDGDTISVSIDGEERTVRLIGVDTPETKHPNKPIEPFGPDATAFTKQQLSGKTVFLEKDVSETDRYGRLLFYVWLARPATDKPTPEEIASNMFNARLLSSGYAKPVTYPPDVKYQSVFSEISKPAQEQALGVWSVQETPANQEVTAQSKPQAQPKNSIADLPETAVTSEETYVGNSNTMKFHEKDCKSAKKIKLEHRVPISTREEAITAGYQPCKQCNP